MQIDIYIYLYIYIYMYMYKFINTVYMDGRKKDVVFCCEVQSHLTRPLIGLVATREKVFVVSPEITVIARIYCPSGVETVLINKNFIYAIDLEMSQTGLARYSVWAQRNENNRYNHNRLKITTTELTQVLHLVSSL